MRNDVGLLPVADGGQTVGFSYLENGKKGHHAVDLGWYKKMYCDVMAWNDGKVLKVWTTANGGDMGNCVLLEHHFGDYKRWSIYMHLHKTSVKAGANVMRGQVLGIRGNTGASHGVHLHFAITELLPKNYVYSYQRFYENCKVNPLNYCYVDEAHDWTNYIDAKKPLPNEEELKEGDLVQLIGLGNSRNDGKGVSLSQLTIGWKRNILSVDLTKPYPYRVGSGNTTTGYYKKEQLKKL